MLVVLGVTVALPDAIPDVDDALFVITLPLAWICTAVISLIISTSDTDAPLINISSGSDLISNKLPNAWDPCLGTITILTSLGVSLFIIYAESSWK